MRNKWLTTVNIKDLLSEDDSEEAVIAAATGIVERLQPLTDPALGGSLVDSIDASTLSEILDSFRDLAERNPDVDEFNWVLAGLYDWADDNRVWLGL